MANMNTLFRKGYLLAGVIMAANMLVVNEVKAMIPENENNTNNKTSDFIKTTKGQELLRINTDPNYFKKKASETQFVQFFLDKVLSYENYINLIGGAVFSGANNYFKLWDYNPRSYWKLGCLGWRSGRLIKGIFQFDTNLNLGRGGFWTILGFISIISNEKQKTVAMYVAYKAKLKGLINEVIIAAYLFITFLQGLVSAPLTVHIAKFDFSISLSIDSIIWEFVRLICWREPSKVRLKERDNFFLKGNYKDISLLNDKKN